VLSNLVDRIYEAAFIPEYWDAVLEEIAELSGSVSSAMLLVDAALPPLWAATPNIREQLGAYAQTEGWYNNPRMSRLLQRDHAGFLRDIDVSTEEEMRTDAHVEFLARAGIENQAATGVQLPTGELVMFTVERAIGADHYGDDTIVTLDALRPHLARSSLLAARLQMTQAQGTVAALQTMGLPAAVLSSIGSVLASNALLEAEGAVLRSAAFGKIALLDKGSDELLQTALIAQRGEHPGVRSVAVRAHSPDSSPAVVHVVPLLRAANDLFGGGATLLVVTSYSATSMVPADAILKGLFDLSAAEAKLAAALSAGQSLKEAATARHISIPTARTQLAQIFGKTGTHQQSELVALLKSAYSIVPPAT